MKKANLTDPDTLYQLATDILNHAHQKANRTKLAQKWGVTEDTVKSRTRTLRQNGWLYGTSTQTLPGRPYYLHAQNNPHNYTPKPTPWTYNKPGEYSHGQMLATAIINNNHGSTITRLVIKAPNIGAPTLQTQLNLTGIHIAQRNAIMSTLGHTQWNN